MTRQPDAKKLCWDLHMVQKLVQLNGMAVLLQSTSNVLSIHPMASRPCTPAYVTGASEGRWRGHWQGLGGRQALPQPHTVPASRPPEPAVQLLCCNSGS